jgi:hypothetical protein
MVVDAVRFACDAALLVILKMGISIDNFMMYTVVLFS